MSVIKFVALAMSLGFVSLTVKSVSKEHSVYVSIACAVVLLTVIVSEVTGLYEKFSTLFSRFVGQGELIVSCGKMIAIAYAAEISSNVLESAEEKGIADKIRLYGKVAIFSSCIPLVSQLAEMIFGLL